MRYPVGEVELAMAQVDTSNIEDIWDIEQYDGDELAKVLSLLQGKKTAKRVNAGSYSFPVFNKEESLVTIRRIYNAMKKAGWLVDEFDFSKVQFDTVDKAHQLPGGWTKGVEAIWRVFPHGEFGNRKSEYVWGTVTAALESSSKGISVLARIYVKA